MISVVRQGDASVALTDAARHSRDAITAFVR